MTAFIDVTIRVTVLLGLATALTLAFQRRSAATRHLVWVMALGGALIVPAFSVVMPAVVVPVPAELAGAIRRAAVDARPDAATPRVGASTGAAPEIVRALPRSRVPSDRKADTGRPSTERENGPRAVAERSLVDRLWSPWLPGLVWLAGVGLLGARSLRGIWRSAGLARNAEALVAPAWSALVDDIRRDLGIRRPVRVLCSPRASIPMTWGWWRPVVLVAAEAESWSTERRLVVLRHELAHVKRRDYLTQLLGQWAVAVYWFHPLVWYATHRLHIERERACDDEVLNLGTRASTYATHLLEIARTRHAVPLTTPAAIAMARPSQLEGRLMAILDPHIRRVGTRAAATGVVVTLAALALFASVVTPGAHSIEPAQTTPPPQPPSPAVEAGAAPHQERAAAEQERRAARQDRLAVEMERRARHIERRVERGARVDVEALTREAEALGREVAARFGHFETALEPEDDPLDPRLVSAFISALGDTDAEVRHEAAEALGRHRVSEAVPGLSDAMDDDSADVREVAAEALGRIGSADGVPALVTALADGDEDVREEAAEALGRIGDPRALDGLIGALDVPQEPDTLEEIIEAIGRIGGDPALDALIALMDSPDDAVRRAAIEALSDGDWRTRRGSSSPKPE